MWRGDSKELFYVGLDDQLTAVPVQVSADKKRLEPGKAVPLFGTRIPRGAVQSGPARQQYAVSSDGQRFLVVTLADDTVPAPITLIQNWRPEARQ